MGKGSWKIITSFDGALWATCDDLKKYLKVYLWLTTKSMNTVKLKNGSGHMFSGLSNPFCDFRFHEPTNDDNLEPQQRRYWNCYTWVCRTLVNSSTKLESGGFGYHHHFKLREKYEMPFPPIPAFLLELYLEYNN